MAVFATKKLTGLDARVGPVTGADIIPSTDAAGIAGMAYGTTWAQGGAFMSSFLGSIYQPLDADLTALAANTNNGLWARTGAGTGAARTITGTASQILVTNGDGVAGNPTLALDMTALDARYIDTVDTAIQTMVGALQLPIGAAASGLNFGPTGPYISADSNLNLTITSNGNARLNVVAGTFLYANGLTTTPMVIGAVTPRIQQVASNTAGASYALMRYLGAGAGAALYVGSTRAATTGVFTASLLGDAFGQYLFLGDDGTQLIGGADIVGFAEAGWSATDHSTRFAFRTRSGAGGLTERVGISSVGALSMGGAANVVIDENRILRPRSYTIATLPAAPATGIIFCSDLGGAGGNLSSNGTAWVRSTDGAPIQLATAAASTFTWQHYTSAVSYFQANPFGATSYTVTLGTTGIVDGAHAIFVREVAATGAGVWDIGGLKSLAPGTGCEVERVAGVWKLKRAWNL